MAGSSSQHDESSLLNHNQDSREANQQETALRQRRWASKHNAFELDGKRSYGDGQKEEFAERISSPEDISDDCAVESEVDTSRILMRSRLDVVEEDDASGFEFADSQTEGWDGNSPDAHNRRRMAGETNFMISPLDRVRLLPNQRTGVLEDLKM